MFVIFKYLEDKKGKPIPFLYKLINNLLTEDDLTYNGNLDLCFSKITSLPDNLTVNGNLDLYASKIKVLPNNLTVNGWLDITATQISKLPTKFYVGGDVNCYGTPLADRIKNDYSLLNKCENKIKGGVIYGW